MSNKNDDPVSTHSESVTPQKEPVNYDFNVDLSDPYRLQPGRTSVNWKTIGLISIVVVLAVGLIFAIAFLVNPNIFRSAPIKTAIRYYELLNAENYREAYDLIEPGAKTSAQFETEIKKEIELHFPRDIEYDWDFHELEFQSAEKGEDLCQVKVAGYIRIIDIKFANVLDIPYKELLTIVKHNGQWTIRP